MASQVLSGAANASYTNNTGQNVRLIINYMANVTSMTWAGVNVAAESTTIGKDIQNITGEFRSAEIGVEVYKEDISSPSGNIIRRYQKQGNEIKLSSEKTIIGYINVDGQTSGVGPTIKSYLRSLPYSSIGSLLLRLSQLFVGTPTVSGVPFNLVDASSTSSSAGSVLGSFGANIFYVPRTISRGGNFPVELMLAPNQAFSAVCGAFNAVVIKEDGT